MSFNNIIPAWILTNEIYVSACCEADLERKMGGYICAKCRTMCNDISRWKKRL